MADDSAELSSISPSAPSVACPLVRTVVLVGLMGAGKTVIGKRLAQLLNVPFKDADSEIETASGMSVSEIFAKHGEPYFRDGERRVIRRLLEDPPHVLATGGGAFMNAQTRAQIAERAVSVWLKAEISVLMKRVLKRNTRPLLAQGDPEATMRRLMEERYPIYATADITVETREGPQDEVVNAIIAALKERRILDSAGGGAP